MSISSAQLAPDEANIAAFPDGAIDGMYHLGTIPVGQQPAAILRYYENEDFEQIRGGIARYRDAAIALPAPGGFTFPLILKIDRPEVARALAALLNEAADQLDDRYTDDELS